MGGTEKTEWQREKTRKLRKLLESAEHTGDPSDEPMIRGSREIQVSGRWFITGLGLVFEGRFFKKSGKIRKKSKMSQNF